MVHINRVATAKEIQEQKEGFEKFQSLSLTAEDEKDDFSATVYGSRWAAEDLPKHEMPVCMSTTWIHAKS